MDDVAPPPPTVVYANDPLCGWCFAIAPQVLAAHARTADRYAWWPECGGLVVDERVRPVAADRGYLRAGLEQVAAVSGRHAGAAYFDDVLGPGTWVSDSEPACRAVVMARELDASRSIQLSCALSDALYVDGRVPDAPDTIRSAADRCGLDGDALVRRWSEPDAARVTAAAWQRARRLGVTTYPSLFLDLHDGRGLVPVLAGWADVDTIVAAVDAGAERRRSAG